MTDSYREQKLVMWSVSWCLGDTLTGADYFFSFRGSAWANTTSQFFLSGLLFLYIWWKKIHIDTWGGMRTLISYIMLFVIQNMLF